MLQMNERIRKSQQLCSCEQKKDHCAFIVNNVCSLYVLYKIRKVGLQFYRKGFPLSSFSEADFQTHFVRHGLEELFGSFGKCYPHLNSLLVMKENIMVEEHASQMIILNDQRDHAWGNSMTCCIRLYERDVAALKRKYREQK